MSNQFISFPIGQDDPGFHALFSIYVLYWVQNCKGIIIPNDEKVMDLNRK